MINYLRYNDRHFNKRLFEFAVNQMQQQSSTGERIQLKQISKETIDSLLESYNIKLKNKVMYDYVYVANMCKSDYLSKSIIDEQHLCKFVQDTVDDADGYDGMIFNRWYADMCGKGIPIDWSEMV